MKICDLQINWRKYIEVLFEGIDELDVNLDDYDKLAVYSVDYLKALMKLLAKTPPSTICKFNIAKTCWLSQLYNLVSDYNAKNSLSLEKIVPQTQLLINGSG